MKKNQLFSIILVLFSILSIRLNAQPPVIMAQQVFIVNGGKFEFAPPYTDYVTVTSLTLTGNLFNVMDTIYTQSAQDILIDSGFVYVAAGDSIVKYNAISHEREASTAFGAPSTIKLLTYQNYLLVGNWYGSSDNNLRIFNKSDLSYVDSIPEIINGAKDMVIIGDSAYVQQNLTSSSFADSAGYLSVIDLTNLTHVRDIHFSNNDEDLGRLQVHGNMIYAMNAGSNTITTYNTDNGMSSTDTIVGDIQVAPYGQQSFVHDNLLYFKFNDALASFDLLTQQIKDASFIDSSITAFTMDTTYEEYYTTHTDFNTYTRGAIFDYNGNYRDSLTVGFSPEAIAIYYDYTIGQDEIFAKNEIKLFPNPVASHVTIQVDHQDNYDFQLYNGAGIMVSQRTGVNGNHVLDMSEFPAGVYIIQLRSLNSVTAKRLVKQ